MVLNPFTPKSDQFRIACSDPELTIGLGSCRDHPEALVFSKPVYYLNTCPILTPLGSRSAARNPALPCASIVLPPFCQIEGDCLSISCNVDFAGQKLGFSFAINKCDNPLTVSVGVKVSALNIDISHTQETGVKYPIPGLSVNVPPFGRAGLVKVIAVTPQADGLVLKVRSRLPEHILQAPGSDLVFCSILHILLVENNELLYSSLIIQRIQNSNVQITP